jgi:hypothetical protein
MSTRGGRAVVLIVRVPGTLDDQFAGQEGKMATEEQLR